MRRPHWPLVALACVAVLGCTRPQEPSAAEPSEVVVLLNERRGEAGCPAVATDARMGAAAQRHAQDMRDRDVRDHTGSDGSTPQQRIEAADYEPAATGEIIFWGTGSLSAQDAVTAWMNSPPHREVIEDCQFSDVGVAVLRDGPQYFAVANFARR